MIHYLHRVAPDLVCSHSASNQTSNYEQHRRQAVAHPLPSSFRSHGRRQTCWNFFVASGQCILVQYVASGLKQLYSDLCGEIVTRPGNSHLSTLFMVSHGLYNAQATINIFVPYETAFDELEVGCYLDDKYCLVCAEFVVLIQVSIDPPYLVAGIQGQAPLLKVCTGAYLPS